MDWKTFKTRYPGFLVGVGIALAALVAFDAYLIYKRVTYRSEIERLRAGMTQLEQARADAILASDEQKFRIMLELLRRQAKVDKDLHLTVSVDSSVMYLEREGALLREMPVEVAPEKLVGLAPDTIRLAVPRGTRTVERILGQGSSWEVPTWVYQDRGLQPPTDRTVKGALGPIAIVLSGGTVVYSMPTAGPLNDSAYVLPGSVRASAADLRAVLPNLKAGMTVYFY